jgi:hypothetical protein
MGLNRLIRLNCGAKIALWRIRFWPPGKAFPTAMVFLTPN